MVYPEIPNAHALASLLLTALALFSAFNQAVIGIDLKAQRLELIDQLGILNAELFGQLIDSYLGHPELPPPSCS